MSSVQPFDEGGLSFRPSPIHGLGGFANHGLPRGARVVEYIGEKITKAESLRRCEEGNTFIFALDDEFDLDGNNEQNPARWLNHSCAPNCEAEFSGGRIWITARRDIAAGEEITFNYGYTLEEYREHPCHCGAPECAGYILAEEFFDHVKKNL
jgi:SET domain-containing protein